MQNNDSWVDKAIVQKNPRVTLQLACTANLLHDELDHVLGTVHVCKEWEPLYQVRYEEVIN